MDSSTGKVIWSWFLSLTFSQYQNYLQKQWKFCFNLKLRDKKFKIKLIFLNYISLFCCFNPNSQGIYNRKISSMLFPKNMPTCSSFTLYKICFEWPISFYSLCSMINDAVTEAKSKTALPCLFQLSYQLNYCSCFTYLQSKSVATNPIDSTIDFGEEKLTWFKP